MDYRLASSAAALALLLGLGCATGGLRDVGDGTVLFSLPDCPIATEATALWFDLGTSVPWPGTLVTTECSGRPSDFGVELRGRSAVLSLGSQEAETLVRNWPSIDAPPFRSHDVESVRVMGLGRVEVLFRDSLTTGAMREDRLLLFADPRLGLESEPLRRTGYEGITLDQRSSVDRGELVVSTHERTLEYAVAAGRQVNPLAWGVTYALASPIGALSGDRLEAEEREQALRRRSEAGGELARWIGEGWGILGNVVERAPWDPGFYDRLRDVPERCGPSPAAVQRLPDRVAPVVYYREGDEEARVIAERVVSASLRTEAERRLVRDWLGQEEETAVGLQARSLGAGDWEQALTSGQGAAFVVALPWGSLGSCGLWSEVAHRLPWAFEAPDSESVTGSFLVRPVGVIRAVAVPRTES